MHVVHTRITAARIASASNLNVFRYACSTSSNCLLIRSRLCDGLTWLSNTVFITFAPHLNNENRSILIRIVPRIRNPRTSLFQFFIIFSLKILFRIRYEFRVRKFSSKIYPWFFVFTRLFFFSKTRQKASLFTEQLIRRYTCTRVLVFTRVLVVETRARDRN